MSTRIPADRVRTHNEFLTRTSGGRSERKAFRRRAGRSGLCLESLEQRTLLSSTLFVTAPAVPSDATHFQSLQAALMVAVAGDTIVLQQGFSPGAFSTTSLTQAASAGATSIRTAAALEVGSVVTIGSGGSDPLERVLVTAVASSGEGDFVVTLASPLLAAHTGSPVDATNSRTGLGPTIGIHQGITLTAEAGVVLPFNLFIWAGTTGVTLHQLDMGTASLTVNGGGNTVSFSTLGRVRLGTGVQGNVFIHNTLVVANGDGLSLNSAHGTRIEGNTFSVSSYAIGLSVYNSSDVVIAGNHITTGAGGTGVYVGSEGLGATSVDLRDNRIMTIDGYGIYLAKYDASAMLEARVQGNALGDNAVGVMVIGDGNSAGNIDLGGGMTRFGTGLGGNDFTIFQVADESHFAVGVFATDAAFTVTAQNNLWSIADPLEVVVDATHIPGALGAGVVVVADAAPVEVLTANAMELAVVQTGTMTGAVATFTSDVPRMAGEFAALIDWGDGTNSTGIVAANGEGGFVVLGAHAWSAAGEYSYTVTITLVSGETDVRVVAHGVARVEPRVLQVQAMDFTLNAKKTFNGEVARFTDNLAGTRAKAYVAAVAWSDGQITAATILRNADGSFSVRAKRSFTTPGVLLATVSVSTLDGVFGGSATLTAMVTQKNAKPGSASRDLARTVKFIHNCIQADRARGNLAIHHRGGPSGLHAATAFTIPLKGYGRLLRR